MLKRPARYARPGFLLLLTFAAGLAVACSDGPTESEDSPLAGLAQRDAADSVGNPLPPPPANPTPGSRPSCPSFFFRRCPASRPSTWPVRANSTTVRLKDVR